MSDLGAADFASYFEAVHGHEPFPWQRRLTLEVLDRGRWPDVIDLPTGTGKTAVLDTAVFSLAVRPELFPRRIVFVIDRRIVVDQVCQRAEKIRQEISTASSSSPTLMRVRERLEALSGDAPLGVVALRGGIPIDGEWARRPDQPWVMVSTVDQFGSRLLFRGYGVSPRMRPVQAGLSGNDCLVILDEVHLSRAFSQTLREVQQQHVGESLPKRFHTVEMSATPTNSIGSRFELSSSDLEQSEELHRRVHAAKAATLVEAKSKQPHEAIPTQVKKILKSLASDRRGNIQSVGVIVNRVHTARETHRALVDAGYSSYLLTGRMRSLDKVRALDEIAELVDPDTSATSEDLSVVVATQAIEVGADFSFDALITEVAPLDSLRQRFGRLDRRGTLAESTGEAAKGWIIGVKATLNPKQTDPVYGHSARKTWERLQEVANDGVIDFTPWQAIPYQFARDCFAEDKQAPLLLRTYMDAWVQTGPEPIVQPAVDWFLHGIDTDAQNAEVYLVWRYDRTQEVLKEVPLRPTEFLPVPIGAAKSWLGRVEEEVPVADIGTSSMEESHLEGDQGEDWARWRGHAECPEAITLAEIQPGDILIVDPKRGGLSEGTWDPTSSETVADLGDEAQASYDRRITLRLDPPNTLPATWPSPPRPNEEADPEESLSARIDQWLQEVQVTQDLARWQSQAISQLQEGHEAIFNEARNYYILAAGRIDPSTLDASDQSSSFTGRGVSLRKHLKGVGKRSEDYGHRIGLGAELCSDLRLAAELHDLGKVDSRFQRQLVGGDVVALAMQEEPLAKSLPGARPTGAEWPPVRHEIMSVVLAQSNVAVLQSAHDPDLVLHLVASHHGWARPLPPIRSDDAPQVLRFDHDGIPMEASTDLQDGHVALEMTDRFWRLVERYGYHGLAWLEAILRLADHQQSAAETTS
ncbi:type I-G CRISPR-associated helicase/endonuclease Cas3g [Candidatus Poriferisocius sp.]|uniref:type I-G CRISPR-associated helicase/endonuclease Cas3g n=1 Tax=Candidatus Poriferisocius sp. TaxID=3101276 RepID=UPI003B5B3024